MTRPLRIAIADDELDMREYFQRMLPLGGHQVVAVAETGKQLIDQCRTAHPDLVITDIKMPDMDGLEAAARVCRDQPVPVIVVTAYHEPDLVERAESSHVLGYLVKPIKQADLDPAIAMAVRRFEQIQDLNRETAELRQALDDRKMIERAKGIAMRRLGLEEPEVFRRLQRLASHQNRRLVELAQQIVSADEVFQALERVAENSGRPPPVAARSGES
jgi:response regulator NasT